MRVVLDTNTVVMPITRGTRSNDSWLIGEWQSQNIIPIISEATKSELLVTVVKMVDFSRRTSVGPDSLLV